jgi:hypothetical protein
MRSIHITLRGPSALRKTVRNRAVLLGTRFTTLWCTEIHMDLKIDADALNPRRRRFCLRRIIHLIYQGL